MFRKGKVEEQDSNALRIYESLSSLSETSTNTVDLAGLIGAPPTMSYVADPRLPGEIYGHRYLENFIKRGTFLIATVGKANFLPNSSGMDKVKVIKEAIDNSYSPDGEALADAIDIQKETELYDFKEDMSTYWSMVKAMIGITANLMGVDSFGTQIYGNPFSQVEWGLRQSSYLTTMSGGLLSDHSAAINTEARANSMVEDLFYKFIPMYTDGILQMNENTSSSVGKSVIEQAVNGNQLRNLSKELTTLTGSEMAIDASKLDKASADERVGWIANWLKAGKNVVSFNMKLPEVWQDSAYDKTYTIPLQFSSPYGDPISVMNNILVPLCHVLPLALPRQSAIAANMYESPYIVKIFSRGHANCRLGMVTNLSIERDQSTVSVNGIPTDMKVVLTVKDLLPFFCIPNSSGSLLEFETTYSKVLSASGLMTYLATVSGYNLHNPETLVEIVNKIKLNTVNTVQNVRENIFHKTTDFINNHTYIKYIKWR